MNLFRIFAVCLCLIIRPFLYSDDKLQIQGNRTISNDTIIYYMHINSFTDSDMNQAVKNLYRTNFFSSILIKKKKEIFKLIVKENYIIKNFIILGNKSIRTINKAISLKEGDFFSEFLMNQDIRSIITAYKTLGYTNCNVSYRVNKIDQSYIYYQNIEYKRRISICYHNK